MHFIRQVMVITAKDLRAEMRTKEAINASFAFAIVVLLILSFAFEPTEDTTREISGGLPNDCLDALIAAPVPGAALFLGKGLANFALIFAVEIVALPVFGIFYNVRWARQFWSLMLVMVLGTWGLTAIGTVFGALTVNIRLREVMLPLLVYPVMIPILLGAMKLSTDLVAGQPISGDLMVWLKLLVGFDIIFTALSLVLMDTVLVG
jgi:heme exporter protein B